MEYIFTTDEQPDAARHICWQNEFLRVFQTDVQVSPEAAAFRGQIRARTLGAATLVNVHLTHEDDSPHVIHYNGRQQGASAQPSIYVSVMLDGQSRYHYDGGCKRAGPGDVLLFDGKHSWASESGRGKHQTLVLKLDRDTLLDRLSVQTLPVVCTLRAEQKLGGLVESYLRSLARLDARQARSLGPALIEHFHALLALAMQANQRGRGQAQAQARELQLEAFRQYAEEHLGDAGLSPESVATRFKVSTRYLHKLYADQGQSFSKWLMQRRLEKCRRDFDDPTLSQRSITEIALSRGFNDMTHFGRCFRAAYGLSPRDWRQLRPQRANMRGRTKGADAPSRPSRVRVSTSTPRRSRRADELRWLTDAQLHAVREQFAKVGENGEAFVRSFYDRLFASAPSIREMFTGDMSEQGAKLLRMLALLVAKAEAPSELVEPLIHLGQRHRLYGVSPDHFAPVEHALLEALAAHLHDDFQVTAREAWQTLYRRAVSTMWSKPAAP